MIHKILSAIAIVAMTATGMIAAESTPDIPAEVTLFKNVKIFDGTTDGLKEGLDVLVVKNKIHKIAKDIPTTGTYEVDVRRDKVKDISAGAGVLEGYSFTVISEKGEKIKKQVEVNVIDGGGRTLMPGMHDMHTHIGISRPPAGDMRTNMDPFLVGAVATARVKTMLMNGFTTIRDIGGPAKFMQRAVDAGIVPGPRILPTEAFITQTAGHGDFRNYSDANPNIMSNGSSNFVDRYYSCYADGPTEIRRCVREQMGHGATQVKIFTGGGISSEMDPLHAVQYTPAEVQAAVEAAGQYGTYVSAHAYTEAHIRLALDNGVKVIEHGALSTPQMAAEMAKNDIWLIPSFKGFVGTNLDDFAKMASDTQVAKATKVAEGADAAYRSAVEAGVKMAFGTDLLGPWQQAGTFENQAREEFLWAAKYMSDFEVLHMATGRGGELHALSGENSPYLEGPTGVIQEGAYADILLVDGNPLENIEIMMDPDKNLKIIMKDGKIYKNTLNTM